MGDFRSRRGATPRHATTEWHATDLPRRSLSRARARLRELDAAKLPDWFDRTNTDCRYQLAIIGVRGWNARVSREIHDNQFTVETDQPNVEVSWQVADRLTARARRPASTTPTVPWLVG
jgi:hypothetical protein